MKNILLYTFLLNISWFFCQDFSQFGCAPFIQNCVNTQFYNATGVGADMINPTGIQFNSFNFGAFVSNSSDLVLKGGELKTRKSNDAASICEVKMYYTIYPTSTPPATPVFLELDLPLKEACSGSNFPTGGPCVANDQKWSKEDYSVDLTTLPANNYTLDVYFEVFGDNAGQTGCATNVLVENGGNRFKAFFEIIDLTVTADGPTTFCQGQFVTLTASPSTNIVWNPMNVTTPSITTFDTGNYSFTYTDNNCTNTSATTSVTVNPYPPIPSISVNGPTSICPGGSTSLVSSSNVGNLWTPNAETSATINVNMPGNYGLSVTVNGCTRNANPVTISESAGPVISVNNPFYCEGQNTRLSASGATTYTWIINGQNIQGNPITADLNGTTSVDVIGNLNGCTSQITVDLTPTGSPTASFDTLVLKNECTYELQFTSTSIGASSNNWFVDDVLISSAPICNHTFTAESSEVLLISANDAGCSDSVIYTVIKPENTNKLFFAPNAITPNGDEFNNAWEVVSQCYKDFHCQIYNRWGQIIFESYDNSVKWDTEYGGSLIAPGIYAYTIKTTDDKGESYFYSGNINVIK